MKVFIGLSGGVDSSVAAALLIEQGHDVTGVYMKNWTKDIGEFESLWEEDMQDAKKVASQLNIPFEVYDFETDYKQLVVDYLIKGYQDGLTPNPDIVCNQEIKFRLFLDMALKNGADMIATGHYARTDGDKLLSGLDETKDQSYFLYRISAKAVSKSLMPIGGLKKSQVRKKADKLGLVTANKPDSQGICFIGEVGIKYFLQQYITPKPGPIIDKVSGEVIGQHDGVEFFTIGQRHGLGVGGGLPYYVVSKDMKTATVYVTKDLNDSNLWSNQFTINNLHWINQPPISGRNYSVKVRYRSKSIPCQVESNGHELVVNLSREERALTPGQSAVLYEIDRVVGGGIISSYSAKMS